MNLRGTATIQEVLGKRSGDKAKSGKLTLEDLPHLLGEVMPKLEYHQLGRLRLISALERRFGKHYRSVPGVEDILHEFDKKARTTLEHHRLATKLNATDLTKLKHK